MILCTSCLLCKSTVTETVVNKRHSSQDLTFGQVMYPKSNLGEVPGSNLSSQLVKPHPPSKCQIIHHPLRMGQIIAGLPKGCALHHLMVNCHVLLCFCLFDHVGRCQGGEIVLMWSRLQVRP